MIIRLQQTVTQTLAVRIHASPNARLAYKWLVTAEDLNTGEKRSYLTR